MLEDRLQFRSGFDVFAARRCHNRNVGIRHMWRTDIVAKIHSGVQSNRTNKRVSQARSIKSFERVAFTQ